VRLGEGFRYALDVVDTIEPADWQDQPDPLFYITARYNRAIETMVRAAPDQYLWVHRRWKSRPRHEREGRPFPPRLLKHLRELPWMTDDEADRIVAASAGASSTAADAVSGGGD
jgi:KDO2-lipid IV(A) lauroyltransferase